MNRRLAIAIVALLVAALPARAGKCGINFDFRFSGSLVAWWDCNGLHFGCNSACGPCGSCGPSGPYPWYTYWPMEAHFQTPTPITYPYWPQVQTPQAAPPVNPASYYQGVAPVSYYQGAAPAYWYGR